jgi:hypothetical protein
VHGGAVALIDCAYRSLNLTDVSVGGHRVDMDGGNVLTDTQKFVVCVEVGHVKTT